MQDLMFFHLSFEASLIKILNSMTKMNGKTAKGMSAERTRVEANQS
jgi:hypothetical protein